jgi:hypothetical protein
MQKFWRCAARAPASCRLSQREIATEKWVEVMDEPVSQVSPRTIKRYLRKKGFSWSFQRFLNAPAPRLVTPKIIREFLKLDDLMSEEPDEDIVDALAEIHTEAAATVRWKFDDDLKVIEVFAFRLDFDHTSDRWMMLERLKDMMNNISDGVNHDDSWRAVRRWVKDPHHQQ